MNIESRHGETLRDRQMRERADLAERLRWAYPAEAPIQHMRSPAWVADLVAWARLGRAAD